MKVTEKRFSEMVEFRRALHQHPELRYEEIKTAALVQNHLGKLGLSFEGKIAETGVVCLLDSGKPGKTVLLRADMDALPIFEENSTPYKSLIEGKMHACGHDGHTAILLGLASQWSEREFAIPKGRILLCFQPAEEGGSGADRMISTGILDKYSIDACFALHVWNHIELGKVGVVPGTMMASVDEFEIKVYGISGHGAMPQHTVDPILVGSHIVTALQSIVSRNVDPLEPAVVTVGSFHAGNAFNVIPEVAILKGTARSYSKAVYLSLPDRIKEIAENVGKAFGAKIEITYKRIDKSTINDPKMADLVKKSVSQIFGKESLTEENTRTMGGEDFSAFLLERPGCYFFVGSRNEKKGFHYPHHSSRFDFDEEAMKIGLSVLQQVALDYLESE